MDGGFSQRKIDGASKGKRQRADKMKQHGRRYQKNADLGIEIASGPGAEKYGHGFTRDGDAVSHRDGRDMFRGAKSVRRGSAGGTGGCPPTCPMRLKYKGNAGGRPCARSCKLAARINGGADARQSCRNPTEA